MDLSGLTDAQIDTALADLASKLGTAASDGVAVKIGEASKTYSSLTEILSAIDALSLEKRLRADAGGGFILGEFGEAL